MNRSTDMSHLLTFVLTLCAVALTAVALRREFAPARRETPAVDTARVSAWAAFSATGQREGLYGAPITLVEFSDFECPYCARLHDDLRTLRARMGDSLAIVFRHFPMQRTHRFALPAAIAAECAGEQGQFQAYRNLLFSRQDSIGLVSWSDLATRAGVVDGARFSRCVQDESPLPRIRTDQLAGDDLGVDATPTILVNDLKLRGYVGLAVLDSIVRRQATHTNASR